MRVIIEVDNEHELEAALEALKSDLLKDQPIQVMAPNRTASIKERQVILKGIFDRYQIDLPPDWRFDRDRANER